MQYKSFLPIVFSVLWITVYAQSQLPKVVSGKIERIENFQSKYVTSRNIDIWLPEGYNDQTKYAVLYMHDGQMLFDPDQSWNQQAWNIDDVATDLLRENAIRNFIVVGIWNSGQTRHQDYFPQKACHSLKQHQ
jgi:predicted alpha/beta superfamily hydrolase